MPYIEQYNNMSATSINTYFFVSDGNTYYKLNQQTLYNELQAAFGSGITLGSIDEHTDVDTTSSAPSIGEALIWDGTNWVPDTAGASNLDALSDVVLTSSTTGDILYYNGTNWINKSRTGTQNYLSKWGASGAQSDSQIRDDGTGVGVGKAPSSYKLDVAGTINMDEGGIVRVAGNKYLHYTHGSQNSANNYCTFLGYGSFPSNNALRNTGIGTGCGPSITTGASNTLIGSSTGLTLSTQTQNTIIGDQAGRVLAANDNVLIGFQAGYNTNSNYNTLVGSGTGVSSSNLTGVENTGYGYTALQFIQGSSRGNIAIGPYSGRQTAGTANYSLAIGYEAHVTADNQVVIGGKLDTSAYLDFVIGYSLVPAISGSGANQQTIRVRPGGTYYAASHTNEGGHNLSIEAGLNYGDGSAGSTKGDIYFKTSSVTASGTTLGTATTRMTIQGGTGYVIFASLPTSSAGLPTGAIWNDSGTIKIA